MEYQVLSNDSIKSLELSVQAHISLGWTPHGGVSFAKGDYIQAIIRIKKEQ